MPSTSFWAGTSVDDTSGILIAESPFKASEKNILTQVLRSEFL
jgi:hypothetical protein